MDILKTLNLLIRFFLELCMLAAVGYWGFTTGSGWFMKALLGMGLPILIAVLWWLAWRLSGLSRLVLELTLLSSGAVALFLSGRPGLAWIYTAILVVNKALLVLWKQ
jgi:hypothetical protein